VIGFTENATPKEEDEDGKSKKPKSSAGSGKRFPIVRFNFPGGSTRDIPIGMETWKIELPSGEVQASRSQVCFLTCISFFIDG